jgi:hypothetical protein
MEILLNNSQGRQLPKRNGVQDESLVLGGAYCERIR